jgi:hypothetical protein
MITLICCLLAGLVLGQRFKVLVLLPVGGFVLLVLLAHGWMLGDRFWSDVFTAVAGAIALQIGYFLGLFAREILLVSTAPADRLAGPPVAQRSRH